MKRLLKNARSKTEENRCLKKGQVEQERFMEAAEPSSD